jgi:hypothetical protein
MVEIITPKEFRGDTNINTSGFIVKPKEFSLDVEEEEKKNNSTSLFSTYNKKESKINTPNEFKPINLNTDYENNPARLYGEKPKTDIINDVRYGWNESQAGFYHLMANIPGGLDAIKDFVGNVPGLGFLDGDGLLASAESYLENRAHLTSAEYLGLDTPDTLAGKVLAGFAMTPITLAEYALPTKVFKSVPLAMAIVDGLRASDEGLVAAGIAAGKGAVLGKIIQASNVLRLPERMGALGALGFATAGGNLEDRLAGGIVFGALGVIGPKKGKTLGDVKRDLLNKTPERNAVLEQKLKEWDVLELKEREAIKLINEQQSKVDNLKDKKSTKKKKEYGEANAKLDTLLEIQNNIRKNKETIERVLHTVENVSPRLAADNRRAVEVKTELLDNKKEAKTTDLDFKGKIAGYLAPMKFMVKNPITKWTADFMSNARIGVENKVENILFDYRVTPVKTGVQRDSQGRIRFGGLTALKGIQRTESNGAALTRAMKMYKKDWRVLEDVIKKGFKIEIDKTAEAKAKKTEVKEVTDVELKTKYKFTKEQIDVYRDLRKGLDNVHNLYNDYINKYVKTIPDATAKKLGKELPYLPNYMPHMFLGDYRVWVNKKSAPFKEPVQVLPANSRWSANAIAKDLQAKFGKDHVVRVQARNKQNITNKEVSAFEDAMRYAEKLGKTDAAKEIHDLYIKTVSSKGFRKHTIKRKNIPGQAGSAEGLKSVLDFLEGYRVYVRGGVQKSYNFKTRKETNALLNDKDILTKYPIARNLAMTYRENALGATSNKITEIAQNVSRKWVGESGIENAMGTLNVAVLNVKLLFGNLRFIASQYIQPFQMIPAKLLHLQSKGEQGNMWEAVIEAQRSLVRPNKKVQEFAEYMVEQRVVEAKFLQEFSEGTEFKTGGKFRVGDKFVLDVGKILDTVTLKTISGKVEQYSRLNAGLMFYHFGIKSGKTHKKAMEDAAYQADKYMVEYNSYERPMIYGQAGLGIVGKSLGLFKTFQHNYFAQMTEHFKSVNYSQLKKGDFNSAKSSVAFLGTMIVTAGALNVIAIDVADRLITGLSPVWERLFGKRPQTVTEMLLESDLPEWVKWGAPSAAIDIDLTTTLAAPGLGIADLVSAPSLEYLGLHPGQLGVPLFKARKGGVIQTTSSLAYKTAMGMATESEYQKVFKSIAPTSFQGIIEAYYAGDKSFKGTASLFLEDKGAYGTLVKDPFKKDRGKIRRDLKDWKARLTASYSINEAQQLKTIYQLSVIDRTASTNQAAVVATAAHHVLNGLPLPRYLFDMSQANNVGYSAFSKQIQNRIKLMNTTLIERELKSKNLLRRSDNFDLIKNTF